MGESKVLSNIPYTIHNYSNYDIVESETRDIVDVPYFPAQNMVDVSGKINRYAPDADIFVPFKDAGVHRLFGLINRTDARMIFIELADDARYTHYKFSGNSFPQGRTSYSYTYDGYHLYISGGYANDRCLNDIWRYAIATNTWENINASFTDADVNTAPSRRRKANTIASSERLYLFGGETDALTVNTADTSAFIVPLNDVWEYNFTTDAWINYDPNRVLPHRTGHIVHADDDVIRIYIVGGVNEIGVNEPTAIWTVNKTTHEVTSTPYSGPFEPGISNACLYVEGDPHVLLSNGSLYKWDDGNTQFVQIYTAITAVDPTESYYWKTTATNTHFGANSSMGILGITTAELFNESHVSQSVKTITLPPVGVNMPRVNIGNTQTFFYGGIYTSGGTNNFNESTYLLNHTTLHVTKYDFDEDIKPTERAFPSLAYDSNNGRVWLYGGFDGTKFYNDLWYFDIGTKTWTLVHEHSDTAEDYPAPRHKSGMCIIEGNFLYIIGGYSDANSYNDFWKYDITSGAWSQEYLTDTIPWGSQYFIFEWRDRLWMYNGQKLYRYFYNIKQFKPQPFLIGTDTSTMGESEALTDDPIFKIIQKNQFLDAPIYVNIINDTMLIQNPEHVFAVDLVSKELMNYTTQYNITESMYWLDSFLGIGTTSFSSFYTNVSPLQPLTRNQIPHSFYSMTMRSPLPDASMYIDTTESTSKITYRDNAGMFKIKRTTIPLEKSELILDKTVSFAALQSDFVNFDFSNSDDIWDETITILSSPTTYPYAPWFEYSKYTNPTQTYEGVQTVVYNDSADRIYAIYKNGNTLKINPEDNTFFVYFTKIWEGAAIGYHQLHNKIYAFGGLRNDRKTYMQDGLRAYRIQLPQLTEETHPGLLEFDLNVNEMNLGSIETYNRAHGTTMVDYPVTRDYLSGLIEKYIEGYAANTIPNSLEDVKQQIYLATQPIVDDLSQFDYVFENGTRPISRAYTVHTQIGNRLYMFGGCECYTHECINIQDPTPYNVVRPGTLVNMQRTLSGSSALYNTQNESRKAVYFDMDSRTWVDIAMLDDWRYMGSAIPSTDERYIYIVGGYTRDHCENPVNRITVYDTQTNTYEDIKGVPSKFVARANPTLYWLDDDRLLIMHGFSTYNQCKPCDGCLCCTYYHIPINDAWIYDKRTHIMYKTFEDIDIQASIIATDSFYIGESKENIAYSLSIAPGIDKEDNVIMKANSWDLVTGIVKPVTLIPTTEIINDYNAFEFPTIESQIDAINGGSGEDGAVTLQDLLTSTYTRSNFRFRYAWVEQYGTYSHKHMFIIGERGDESGITHLEAMARGYKEAHLRLWYVDLEVHESVRYVHNIPYEYPLPVAPVVIAYDGSRYLYAIYNKYNIWRLDFKSMLSDSSGSYWYQCPPCLDCNFLGDSRTNEDDDSDAWNAYFTKPNYLTLISKQGRMSRMDTNTFVWYLDKKTAPSPPTKGASLTAGSEVENNEVYLYDLGGVSGKVMDVDEKQWDNFFLDMRHTSRAALDYETVVSDKLWPTFLRRNRLYTMNHLGHVFYSWLRIDGKYDVEFQTTDFYDGTEIRIYGDDNLLNNHTGIELQVFTINSGWVDIANTHFTTVANEVGWDWDGEFSRQYVRMFIDQNGDVAYNYSKMPPNYVSVDLEAAIGAHPISKMRIAYKNIPRDYNYVSRINNVELLTDQTTIASYETTNAATPLSIVHIQPITIDDEYSNQFAVYVRNDGDDTATEVQTYAYDNDWLQFNLDPTTYPDQWTIRDQDYPYLITDTLLPGATAVFYIRAVNIDSRPHAKDLVVKGIYTYSG